MEAPHVRNVYEDTNHRVTYNVIAYRELTRVEMVMAVRQYLAQLAGPPPRRGDRVTIVTLLGRGESSVEVWE